MDVYSIRVSLTVDSEREAWQVTMRISDGLARDGILAGVDELSRAGVAS